MVFSTKFWPYCSINWCHKKYHYLTSFGTCLLISNQKKDDLTQREHLIQNYFNILEKNYNNKTQYIIVRYVTMFWKKGILKPLMWIYKLDIIGRVFSLKFPSGDIKMQAAKQEHLERSERCENAAGGALKAPLVGYGAKPRKILRFSSFIELNTNIFDLILLTRFPVFLCKTRVQLTPYLILNSRLFDNLQNSFFSIMLIITLHTSCPGFTNLFQSWSPAEHGTCSIFLLILGLSMRM